MSDFGISSTGFKRKKLDQLLLEINDEMKAVFGENLNVTPESPDGQVNGVVSESNANLWEIAEESYNAFDPAKATNVSLSNLVQLNGLTRGEASSSRASLTLTGTAATVIPAGSLVSTSDTKVVFVLEAEVTLDGGGSGTEFASAQLTGPLEAAIGTITVIDTPVTGWTGVTNAAVAVLGTNEETDPELRARRENSVARDAQAIIDAIFAAIAAVTGVTQLTVLENDTNSVDGNGQPAHSTHAVVVGGADDEIAEAYFVKKTPGVPTFGTTTVAVDDVQGIPHNINFSRPTEIEIFIIANLTTFANFPVDGVTQIQQAIIDYANGDLVAGREFALGDDVIFSELYTPINAVIGHQVDSLFIKISAPADETNNIPIAFDEISSFLAVNITVNT